MKQPPELHHIPVLAKNRIQMTYLDRSSSVISVWSVAEFFLADPS
jgi:hypothetical protein